MSITQFMDHNFRHFNARETLAAARAWKQHLDDGGKMLVALAGAVSTGEMGVSLAKMIRADKIHAICCTAANLEEDIFNLTANETYRLVPNYRDLSPTDELALRDAGFNRVTDTCIPENVFRTVEGVLERYWNEASETNASYFPYEYIYRLIDEGVLKSPSQVQPEESWVLAAYEKKLAIYTPGWEDSTMGNVFAARVMQGKIKSHGAVKTGTAQMEHLIGWYRQTDAESSVGFFQIGGGIAGDFAICAVPTILQDLRESCRYWGYFAQISDSTTSYGSYSGAVPNEKITWHKLDTDTPKFMINSDASIVAPLIFAYVLGE